MAVFYKDNGQWNKMIKYVLQGKTWWMKAARVMLLFCIIRKTNTASKNKNILESSMSLDLGMVSHPLAESKKPA